MGHLKKPIKNSFCDNHRLSLWLGANLIGTEWLQFNHLPGSRCL